MTELINMAGFRFIFTIFVIAVLLISAVHLRNQCDRICYLIYSVSAQQGRLKQELWQKQLRLEGYLNPTSVLNSLSEQ
jgi:hypothetical protein